MFRQVKWYVVVPASLVLVFALGLPLRSECNEIDSGASGSIPKKGQHGGNGGGSGNLEQHGGKSGWTGNSQQHGGNSDGSGNSQQHGGSSGGTGNSEQHGGNGGGTGHRDPPKKHRVDPNYDPAEHMKFHDKHKDHGHSADDIGYGNKGGGSSTTYRPTTTTEPDWDYICYHLCQSGDGGLACDCDLLPIGK